MKRNLTCIICPRGCALTAEITESGVTVTGNACPKGEEYAINECTNPVRTVTATVRVAKAAPEAPLLAEIRQFMERRFPDWKRSPSVGRMTPLRKIALYLIEHRHYRLLGWLFRMKG